MSKYEKGLFIFYRDLRIIDNTTLIELNRLCKSIITIFIFTPEQVTSENKFKSKNSVQFMIESLADLEKTIQSKNGKLHIFFGNNISIIKNVLENYKIDVFGYNKDITPFATQRDNEVNALCHKMSIPMIYLNDYYLQELGTILNNQNQIYKKFTPYYNNAIKHKIRLPSNTPTFHFSKENKTLKHKISLTDAFHKFTVNNSEILLHGGRKNAIPQFKIALKSQKNYAKTHNNLDKNTSLLSAYIKFCCLSIREVYQEFKSNKAFVRQLFWRDFYANILFAYPYVLGKAMKPNYSKIKWKSNKKWLDAWCKGETGFPIVDAAMRELNVSGYQPNRGRLITSSFLVKTLLIDWQLGEKYFAQQLVDYDPASNNGNWQWTASTGADSQPYFRIFNPWLQQKEYDPECLYIKKWIPELADLDNKTIHNWYKEYNTHMKEVKYPKPICDFDEQKKLSLQMYKAAFL